MVGQSIERRTRPTALLRIGRLLRRLTGDRREGLQHALVISRRLDENATVRHRHEPNPIERRQAGNELGGRAGGLLRDVRADRIGLENDDDRAPGVVQRIGTEGRREEFRGQSGARRWRRAEADELERTDVAQPAVDLQRDVGRGEIGHRLAVLRQREKVQPDQVDGGAEGFGLRCLARTKPGGRGQGHQRWDHHPTGEHGRDDMTVGSRQSTVGSLNAPSPSRTVRQSTVPVWELFGCVPLGVNHY